MRAISEEVKEYGSMSRIAPSHEYATRVVCLRPALDSALPMAFGGALSSS
ncbi:MAG: hypothetical protein A4E45_01511 [Methanosaeta sp. PtaB.Bin039]|nr:MAG: hypothetical protein A4E45_01511 [Methanosaeta sp. PtaB.Bin039]